MNLRSLQFTLVVAGVALTISLSAQENATSTPGTSQATTTNDSKKKDDPVKASFGYTSADGVLLNLKGKKSWSAEPDSPLAKYLARTFGTIGDGPTVGYLAFDSDGSFSVKTSGTRKAIFALRAGLWYGGEVLPFWRLHEPIVSPFLDVHERLADLQVNGNSKGVSQLALGGGVAVTMPGGYHLTGWLADHHPAKVHGDCKPVAIPSQEGIHGGKPCFVADGPPIVSIGYYWSGARPDPSAFSNDVKTNQILAKLNWTFTLPFVYAPFTKWPLQLQSEIAATKPTTGTDRKMQWKQDVGLILQNKGAAKPILKYVFGTKEGVTFKKEVLAGIAFDLADAKFLKRK